MATTRGYDRQTRLSKNLADIFGGNRSGHCRVCGNPVENTSLRKYCSKKCRGIAYTVIEEYAWSNLRKRVLRAYDWQCVRCGTEPADRSNLHADHIMPLSRGGAAHDERNLQPLCAHCHDAKGLDGIDFRPDGGPFTRESHSASQVRAAATGDDPSSTTPAGVRVLDRDRFTKTDSTPTLPTAGPGVEPPEPAEDLPEYVVDPLVRQGLDELDSIADFVDARREYLALTGENSGLQTRYIDCGPGCSGCPHGPYVYRGSEYVGPGRADLHERRG